MDKHSMLQRGTAAILCVAAVVCGFACSDERAAEAVVPLRKAVRKALTSLDYP